MMNWTEISSNPNAPSVLSHRISALREARASLITDRLAYLIELARDKDVLDIGVVEHNMDAVSNPNWLHRHLLQVAKSMLGVDVLEAECRRLREMGFDVACVDLTQTSLDRTFDLIVMGELIEHLDNPGLLLRNTAKMLRRSGTIVITTPNPWYINPVLKSFSKTPFTDSADHVAWFDASTLLELGRRCGLTLRQYRPVVHVTPPTLKARSLFTAIRSLARLGLANEGLLAQTMLYEFTLEEQ